MAEVAQEELNLTENEPIHPDLDEEKLDTMLTKLSDAKRKYHDYRRRNIEPIWDAGYEAYHAIPREDHSPYQANYTSREVYRQLESLKPLVAVMLLPDDGDWFRYESAESDTDDRAYRATAKVHYDLYNLRMVPQVLKWLDQSHMWGVSYLYYDWRRYRSYKRKIARVDGEDDVWSRESTEVAHDAPWLEWLEHWRVYTDPFIEDPRESPFVFIEQRVTGTYLKTMVREGRYDLERVKKLVKDGEPSAPPITDIPNDRLHEEELEHIVDLIPDDEEFDEMICYSNNGWEYVIINQGTIVRATENPHGEAPIFTLRANAQPGEHYGVGDIEVLIPANNQLYDFTNMWVDDQKMRNNPMMKVRTSEANNWRKARMYPGSVVQLDDLSAVEPLAWDSHHFELAQAQSMIKLDMQLANGMTDEVTGAGSGQKTATGIVRLQNAASNRIEHKIRHYLPVFVELWAKVYDLYAENMTESANIRVAGDSGKRELQTVTPGDFAPRTNVLVEVSPTIESKGAQQQRFGLLWQQIGQDPRFNHEVIAKPMLRAWGIRNPSRAWANPMQTQNDVAQEIKSFEATGYIEPAMPSDNHQVWIQLLSMYTQTPGFQTRSPESQALFMARIQQHQQYMMSIMGAAGQASQNSPFAEENNEVVPGQEEMTNAETGSRMAGALQQGGEAAQRLIQSGQF